MPQKPITIMLIKAMELACVSSGFNSAHAINPIACPPAQIPISAIINAVIPKDILGHNSSNAKLKAVKNPLITIGFFRDCVMSDIQPTMGEPIAQLKFKMATKIAACVEENEQIFVKYGKLKKSANTAKGT